MSRRTDNKDPPPPAHLVPAAAAAGLQSPDRPSYRRTMMPVVPMAKRANGFTIDSLMGKENRSSRSPEPEPARSRSNPLVSSSIPINLTASAEAAVVPPRDGSLLGGCGSGFHPVHSSAALLSSMKSLYAHEHPYPEGLTAAAAFGFPVPLAASTANGLPHGLPPGFGPAHPGFAAATHPLLLGAAGAHREHFSIYPWLMSRHGGYFGHNRFPGPDAGHLLLQPFRKPKRIRTAFSPSQLLRLEHAFEKNHYVVGQERKDLAVNLNLTETQVKVWFQNRRTKYKRMKAEEAEGGRGGAGDTSSSGSRDHAPSPTHSGSDLDEDPPHDISSCKDDDENEHLEMELLDDEEDEQIDCVSEEDACVDIQPHPAVARSPSPSSVKTAHHVERWRTDTNQIQVV